MSVHSTSEIPLPGRCRALEGMIVPEHLRGTWSKPSMTIRRPTLSYKSGVWKSVSSETAMLDCWAV